VSASDPQAKPDEATPEDLYFINLVTLVASTAAAELGDKKAGKPDGRQNLPRARQFINMLKTLQDRTQGRRNVMEDKVLGAVLSDLQARYVKAAGLDREDPNLGALGRLAMQAYGQTKKP
jgi:hypothetical protein